MKKAKLNVPVLMVFFIRPDMFRAVFEQVKTARPAELYLFQDGARENHPTDEQNRMACQEVLKDIDWECDVKTFYPDFNYGVDSSVYAAIKWAFTHVERLIILEDDIVTSPTFFKFCDVLLEEYKDDESVAMIGGMNHLGTYKAEESSYLFAQSCAIWGWATWKRFFDSWVKTMDFLEDKDKIALVKAQLTPCGFRQQMKKARRLRTEALENKNKASFEASATFARLLNRQCAIVPTKNLISNIGIGEDTFHATNNVKKLSSAARKLFFMKSYDLSFPLIPPKNKNQDIIYNKKIDWILSPPFIIRGLRKLESKIRRVFFK